jgi:lysophospholipase L1-like esterase
MSLPSNSTEPSHLARWIGIGLIALVFYALFSAVMLSAGYVLLGKGLIPDVPWIAGIQKYLYRNSMRTLWQRQIECVDFDAELIYKPKPGTCKFNNPEFKTTLNFSAEGRFTGKKPEGSGIVVIGDSHAMGWGVNDEETFSAELQRLIRRPVYNLGVSSYGTVRELLNLKRSGLLAKADTVILQYCENDLSENQRNQINDEATNRGKFQGITTGKPNLKGLVLSITRAYGNALAIPFKRLVTTRETQDFQPHYQKFIALLKDQPELAKKRVLVFYNNGDKKPFHNFPNGKDGSLGNVEFVDIEVTDDDRFRLDDHMSSAGHKKVAAKIYETLKH